MRLVVTGGAGFLGYHLCNFLADRFEKITVLDIAAADPAEYPANVEFVRADVRDPGRLEEAFRGAGAVIHSAAALPLWRARDIFEINVGGTKNVLEAASRCGVGRVVHISSTAVYGVPDTHPVPEDYPLDGVGSYGKSKVMAEQVCAAYRKKGMCVAVLRPKTFIGPGRLGVFHLLYDWVESGRKIPVIGDGKNRYQLLDVEDLAEAVRLLVFSPGGEVNDTFNAGAQEFGTVLADVGGLCAYAGTGARVLPVPAWLVKPPLALLSGLRLVPLYKWVYDTADKDSFVSTEKLRSRLGWSPRYSNAQALIRSFGWYREHKDGLAAAGVTHRAPWNQGILSVFKRFL